MKNLIKGVLKNLGYSVAKNSDIHKDIREEEFWEIFDFCKEYTMTSVERLYSLYGAVLYVLQANIKGDFVECGVWRGGSAMMIGKILSNRNIFDRKIYLYDTFEGMSKPTEFDITLKGEDAADLLAKGIGNKENSVWCLADLQDVQRNMSRCGLNERQIVYIKGMVENTIPNTLPDAGIALLRLDTDWYESTKHELNNLYPLLAKNGVLIIDDYGYWEGSRKATDEYFKENQVPIMLNRVDNCGRLGVKAS